ncbi:MAG: Asp23/Gls24 family envelope stress response protein [Kibdelosporangium sp.]
MAVNPETQGYLLPCGRDVETVWERLAVVEAGQGDEHDLTCPDCRDARASLTALREVTGELLADTAEPTQHLTGRIMAAVRAEVRRRHDMVPLPTAEPGRVRVSEHAVAAVLRFAADSVAGVRARRCRVHTFRQHSARQHSARQHSADLGEDGEPMLVVELGVAVSYQSFAWRALDLVRERVTTAAATRIGPRLHRLDLIIEDVYGA